jgi:hypothetical protein
MSSEPGGRADKLGNEFERLGAVRHLIELVEGRATSFKMEALGDDEKGTEFWVGRSNGTREAHQYKRENGTTGKWTIADLESKRIISNAKLQLDRDPSHRFSFTSGDKVIELSDLAERAGRCDDPTEFVQHLTTTSQGHQRAFRELCRHLAIDPNRPEDQAKALDFLRRFRTRIVDKNGLRDDVEELAARWITGEPKEVVAALKNLLDGSLGRTLRESDVIASLPNGSRPRDLAKDPSLHTALEELRARFDRSYRHLLIGGQPLGRSEAADLLSRLTDDDGPRLVLIHGPGGDGKSGVTFELVEHLARIGIPCLPLRLDRDRPEDTPLKFGRALGLPGSPASSLAAAADGRVGVLILDQVDAIRWTAAHSSYAWDTCERMVSEALAYPNLRVVVVCRSFDVEDDPRIRAWKRRAGAEEYRVGPLDDPTVDAVVAACGMAPPPLDSTQRRVLRSPQGLYLWRALHEGENLPPAFRTMTDLMRAFWAMTRRRLKDLRQGEYEAVLDALVAHMDRRGTLAAPRTIVDHWPDEVAALISMNVLVEGFGDRLLFAHQSYLDYLTAVRVLRGVFAGTGRVLDWLSADDQSLFRRGQLRQLLALLRDDDSDRYAESMREILEGDAIRFHLKHLALQLLGHAEPPTSGEVDLVLDLLRRPEWVNHIFLQVVAGRGDWFDALHERGILRGWLDASDQQWVNLAINIIERVVETRGAAVESLLLDRGQERWPGRLDAAVWRTPLQRLSDNLFDAVVASVRPMQTTLRGFVDWKALGESSPGRCVRFLAVWIERNLDRFDAMLDGGLGEPVDRDDSSLLVGLTGLAAAASAISVEAWDVLMPCYLRVLRFSRVLRRRVRDGAGNLVLFDLRKRAGQRARVLRAVLTAAGRAMAECAPDLFWHHIGSDLSRLKSVERLLARCISHGPDDRADAAIRWLLKDPSRFCCGIGTGGAAYGPARRLLRRYAALCSDALFVELQAAILAHRPVAERETYKFHHDRVRRNASWGKHPYDILACNELGLGQHVLLSGVPWSRLSPDARGWAGVLRRKFGSIKRLSERKPRHVGGWVGSTIPGDRLSKLSDSDWLTIIAGDWSRRSRRWKQMGPNQVGEVSVEMFARDLEHVTHLQPARFARWALRISVEADSRYPIAILQALAKRDPPRGSAEGQSWEQATVAEVEAVLRRFAGLEGDREFAMAVCQALTVRAEADWTDDAMLLLVKLASGHSDPLPGHYSIRRARRRDSNDAGADRPDVEMSAINCVRGAAAGAIKSLLFHNPERLRILRPAVDSLLGDPHAAVRVAAVGLAVPLLNVDRKAALDAFLRACAHPDDEVLGGRDLNHFLSYTILDHADRLQPLIDRMVASSIGDVAKAGAIWAAVAWSHRELLQDTALTCVGGSVWQRIGLAEGLAGAVARGRCHEAALGRLQTLFDDPEKAVRDVASRVFREEGLFETASAVALAEAFLRTRALDDNVDDLLQGLERQTKSLRPYSAVVCALADRFAGPLAAEARDHRTRRPLDAGLLAKLLLRLYEQSESDRGLRRSCLGAWDGLLRERLGYDVLRNVDI